VADTPPQLGEVDLSFVRGENHVAHETAIPESYARRVENFDLHNSGVAVNRPELRRVGGQDVHSIWTATTLDLTLMVEQDRVARYRYGSIEWLQDEGGAYKFAGTRGPMYFEEFNEEVYFTNGFVTGVVMPDGTLRNWGVENPVAGNRSVNGDSVRYLTYQDAYGQESGAVRFDNGTPPYVPGHVPRLYWADEASSQYRLNGTGRKLHTQGRTAMPPGRYLTFFGGRAFVARGVFLYYSDPLNPGLCDVRYNFEEFPSPITGIGAMQSGLYVTTLGGVYYAAGADPTQWSRGTVSEQGAIAGSGLIIPADVLNPESYPRDVTTRYAYAYLTRNGLAIAWDRGRVQEPAAGVLRFPTDTEVRLSLLPRDGYYQLVAVPQNPVNPAAARAIDTPITQEDES